MSTYDLYIFNQTHTLTLSTGVNSNMPMYDKNIILYHGVDNKINFVFRDNDRTPYDISNTTVYFNMIGTENKETVVSKIMTITSATKGEAQLDLTSQDVYNISEGLYNYSIYTQSSIDQTQKIAYTDRAGDFQGTAEVRSGGLPSPRPTQTVDSFTLRNNFYYSNSISGSSERNLTARNHTVAMYTTGFTGNVFVEGNLDDQASTDDNDWFPLDVKGQGINGISFTSHTGVDPFFFEASVKWIRIKYNTTAGTLDKVLLRN